MEDTQEEQAQKTVGSIQKHAEQADEKIGTVIDKADAAGAALTSIQKRVFALTKEADIIEYVISARRVQDVDGLTADLRNGFKGQQVVLKSYIGDEEGYWLCSQLVDIAKKAEMDAKDECVTEQIRGLPVTDLQIRAPSREEALKLSRPLKKPGRVPGLFVMTNEGPVLTVLVGVKASVPVWPPKRPEETLNKSNNKNSAKP